ncbi:capsid assembly protein [Thalassospira mesophila]|uniref:capsid assembly protein n=1 Tax=Thalassospira mesophila TaxID=1293891 RepID=UPI000A1DD5D3|nr:hypothetical protein [Thalassospira mesophila]
MAGNAGDGAGQQGGARGGNANGAATGDVAGMVKGDGVAGQGAGAGLVPAAAAHSGNILSAAGGSVRGGEDGVGGGGTVGGAAMVAAMTRAAETPNADVPAFRVPGPDSSDAERQAFYAALGVPQSPADYEISGAETLGGVDEALNARLHEAGFTGPQAQLVYDLASEILSPMVAQAQNAAQMAEMQGQLAAEFGGAEHWAKLAPRIASWGQKNLPGAYEAMAQSPDGVRALYRLMQEGSEPGLAGNHAGQGGTDPQNDINRLMNDPRYWRDRNPALVAQVQAAFDRLHRGD